MAWSKSVRQIRQTLAAGVLTAISPPSQFSRVMIGAVSTDVLLYTNDDLSEYRTIATGFEREVRAPTHYFRSDETAFWLKSTGGGLVILEWN